MIFALTGSTQVQRQCGNYGTVSYGRVAAAKRPRRSGLRRYEASPPAVPVCSPSERMKEEHDGDQFLMRKRCASIWQKSLDPRRQRKWHRVEGKNGIQASRRVGSLPGLGISDVEGKNEGKRDREPTDGGAKSDK